MNEAIRVLSPHRDDAVFSLFLTLSEWSRQGARIRVTNFFTRSAYAPRASTTDPAKVSEIRRREDRAALRRISPSLRIDDRNLLDAPLRLSIPAGRVCYTEPQPSDIALVEAELGRPASLTLCPLGLGGHVDHRTVKYAALAAAPRLRLAFYEDLPYAMWSDLQLRSSLIEVEDTLHLKLLPTIIRGRGSAPEKRAAAARYRSQIRAEEAHAIATWSRRYGVAERIWSPPGCRLPALPT